MSEEEKAELEELYENSEWWHNRFKAVQRDYENLKKKYENAVADYEFEKYKNSKAIDKLYCYGEVFDSKILQQFQREMIEILGDKENEET